MNNLLDSPNKKLLFYIYISFNVLVGLKYMAFNELGGALKDYTVDSRFMVFLCIALVISSFYLIGYIFEFFKGLEINSSYSLKVYSAHSFFDYCMLGVLLVSFYASFKFGFERVGSEDVALPFIFSLFFKIISPTYLVGIYLAINFNSRKLIFFINVILFVLLGLYKGYSGPILHVGFLLLYRLYINERLSKKIFFIVIVSSLFLGPLSRIIKNMIIVAFIKDDLSVSAAFQYMYQIYEVNGFWELYFMYIFKFIERFESISTLYYILDQKDTLIDMSSDGVFYPFYLYHWLPQTIEKTISYHSIFEMSKNNDLQTSLANLINPIFKWRSQTTYFSWLFIKPYLSPLYFIYTLILVFISVRVSMLLSIASQGLLQLTWFFTIVFVTHGWFDLYISYIQALIVYYLISCVFTYLKLSPLKLK